MKGFEAARMSIAQGRGFTHDVLSGQIAFYPGLATYDRCASNYQPMSLIVDQTTINPRSGVPPNSMRLDGWRLVDIPEYAAHLIMLPPGTIEV